jgi:hypothetical protein
MARGDGPESDISKNSINLPHRRLSKMIGEEFIVLPLDNANQTYFGLHYVDKPKYDLFNHDIASKKLTLLSINITDTEARFKDNDGNEYIKQLRDGIAPGLLPISEIEAVKKYYTNLTIWVNRRIFSVTKNKNSRKIGVLEPVKIINVSASNASYVPVRLTLRTLRGEIGVLDVDVSGTNTNNDLNSTMETIKDFRFKDVFYQQNPRLAYKLTPAMWKIVEKGNIYLGMPSAAFEVLSGKPQRINRTTGFYGVHEQWVYGDNQYYYFEIGKLTTVQN